ncbi:MAG: TetR/AcrR family transcriptional regulator [Gammaproteobacteria bacterium]|nr:TetR/AcrR family transcriptional regulator [Gammaproteobacteria bacterium]
MNTDEADCCARWQRRKEARPQEIVDAALDIFVERGFAATRLDDVARRAGVSKGTVYRYFENKDALFVAVVKEIVVPEVARIEKLAADFSGSGTELLRSLIQNWWQTVGETRLCGIPKMVMADAGNFPELARLFIEEVVSRMRVIFESIVEKGIQSGEFRQCDIKHAARAIMAPMVLAAIWERSLKPFDNETCDTPVYLDTYLDLIIEGIRKDTIR